jgi:polyhydroxyalkanoate synthesis repressor PhaR
MRIIKKYSNRRLYDTSTSTYVNFEQLAGLVRAGEEVKVLDVQSGEDITRATLLQVVLESQGAAALFPPGLLHRIIRFSAAGPGQALFLQQVGMGLELLDVQLTRLERQMGWFKADVPPPAAGPAAPPPDAGPPDEGPEEPPPAAPRPAAEAELDALRERLAALEGRLRGGR